MWVDWAQADSWCFENNVHPVMFLSLSSDKFWSRVESYWDRAAQVCLYPQSRHVQEAVMIASVFLLPSKENVFLLPQVPLRNSALTFMGLGLFFSPLFMVFIFRLCWITIHHDSWYSRVIAVALTPVALSHCSGLLKTQPHLESKLHF